jgi:hypothetical protein
VAAAARALLQHPSEAADRLIGHLAQPVTATEPFTSRPAEWTDWGQLLARVEEHAAV